MDCTYRRSYVYCKIQSGRYIYMDRGGDVNTDREPAFGFNWFNSSNNIRSADCCKLWNNTRNIYTGSDFHNEM